MILDGNRIAAAIRKEVKEEIDRLKGRKPCLAAVLVGDYHASKIYVARKSKACEETGIVSIKLQFPAAITESELLYEIANLNDRPDVDGILVQLPLPSHINTSHIISAISPNKDIDGFHPLNMGKLLIGESDGFAPCTPYGIQVLLARSNVHLSGMNVLILGRSNIVGKPLAALLMQNKAGANATVTVAHSLTKNINELSLRSDLIVAAMGKPLFLTKDMVRQGAIVVDVGINRIDDPAVEKKYRIVGDADFENLKEKCSMITPVPGGVGPMTIAMLLSNTLKSYRQRNLISL